MGPIANRVFVVVVFCGLTAWVVWGWVAFSRKRSDNLSLGMVLSVVGFCFASVSTVLSIGSGTYAQFRGGFPFYDPTLLRIYFWGFCLAAVGLVCGLAGIGKKSPLRFKAPALSLFMLLLWLAQAMGE